MSDKSGDDTVVTPAAKSIMEELVRIRSALSKHLQALREKKKAEKILLDQL